MSSVEKTIKIIKRKNRESLVDQTQGLLKTDKQSRREMASVVASWIEERKNSAKNQPGLKASDLERGQAHLPKLQISVT